MNRFTVVADESAEAIIGQTVGGNGYGWLVTNSFDPLALDNVTRVKN